MTTSDPPTDSHEIELIAEELGIGAIDAIRARQLILAVEADPENSILSLSVGSVVSEHADKLGYRRIWSVLYCGLLVEVGELWDLQRQLLNISRYPVN
jgi:hypothetical protein